MNRPLTFDEERELRRMDLWTRIYVQELRHSSVPVAVRDAETALAEFDKVFPAFHPRDRGPY